MKPSSTAHFDTANSFSKSGRGSGGTEVLEKKCLQVLSLSFPAAIRSLFPYVFFSLVCTDREPGTGYISIVFNLF